MKSLFSTGVTACAIFAVLLTWRSPASRAGFDFAGFARLPVLVNGRVKPLDTVARTSLLMAQGRQRVRTADGQTLTSTEWLLDMFYRPQKANELPTFEITHPEVLALLNLTAEEGAGKKRFSLHQFASVLGELDRQAKLADEAENAVRSSFQRAVIQLRDAVAVYQRLQNSVAPADDPSYLDGIAAVEAALDNDLAASGPAPAAPHIARRFATIDSAQLLPLSREFTTMESLGYFRAIPPASPGAIEEWRTVGAAWNETLQQGTAPTLLMTYSKLGRAWRDQDVTKFNHAVAEAQDELARTWPRLLTKMNAEARFNQAQPFYSSALLYVGAFLLGIVSWLRWPEMLRRGALNILSVAFVLSTVGIGVRMWLESRPPVTNLYSSALFVGWGAVGLCLTLEAIFKNAIGSVVGGLIGFAALVIAHHLALGGDTLEMMRAVLDSNFWLATHVVTVTVGYSATFLAGFLGVVYVLRGTLTRSLDPETAKALLKMIHGVVCFATLFSFVGTVLGGIWADQSWGRFWGWDPKENGALLIVMWNSIVLHARWGGLVRDRGLAALVIFGNVVTAWSWFGVNMLGVGLHSYGFMDAAFWWLIAFVVTQVLVIALAMWPITKWRSAVIVHG